MSQTFDAIIIGTGQSGPFLATRLAQKGMRVAIAERQKFGGTCVNTGCIPTKTLVASARVAQTVRRAAEHGVTLSGPAAIDMKKVKARKDGIVAQSNVAVEKGLRSLANCTVLHGHASFEGPRTVRVGEDILEAPQIFINVGARAFRPPIPGLDTVDYLTNSSMMDVDFLPPHLLVIGGSYVGLEFAQMYRRFGSEVTVIQRGHRLISREDDDIADAARAILEAEGIRVLTGTCDFRVEKRDAQIAVVVDCQGVRQEAVGSHLLLAVGRVPNTQDLGLEKAGVEVDANGYIRVDDQLRTNVPGIWAMGDCNGKGAFTHTSYNDYEIVAANLLDHDPAPRERPHYGVQPVHRSSAWRAPE